MKRCLAILMLLGLSFSFSFCESWFVCLGSFKIEENAINFVKLLKEKGFEAGIDKNFIRGELFNRVLLKIDFDDVELARKKRDVILSEYGVGLKLKDLWVCIPSKDFYSKYEKEKQERVAHHFLEKPTMLEKNNLDVPISDKTPYSILMNKYKEELVAENDKKRLRDNDIDAYIIKTYSDEDFFSFNLHVGAFEEKEEASSIQEKLKNLGLKEGEVVDYNDFAQAIEKYDEVVAKETIKYQDGQNEIPTSFSPNVATCIKEFPINKDFQIEEIHIFDLDNIRKFEKEQYDISKIENSLQSKEKTHAASIAFYKDSLFNKKVEILIQKGLDDAYTVEYDGTKNIELQANGNILFCSLREEDSTWLLQGVNKERNFFVSMKSHDFSEKEFELFLNNISNDSSLLAYPQIRKNLLVLPKENPLIKRDFLSFSLTKVDKSYAKERGYARWAIPVVGHWNSVAYFNVDKQKISIAFFDLDYDKIAQNIHGMFMNAHKHDVINYSNMPINLKRMKGWFVETYGGGEVSFSCKSYVIAVNSYSNGYDKKGLVELGDDLQIWE